MNKIQLEAKFKFNFIAEKLTPELQEKMNTFAKVLAEKLSNIAGMEPDIDIHWNIEIQSEKVYDLQDVLK